MKSVLAAAIAFSLLAGSVTTAYAGGRDNHRRSESRHHYDRNAHVGERLVHRYKVVKKAPKHSHKRAWRQGDRLPRHYHHANRYVVHNHYSYRLRTPPRGHQWVRVNNDVILTAIATGLVVEVVSGLFNY